MTDLRPYFTQTIGHNSVNVHRIATKRGTKIRRNESFTCAKFQPNWSMHSCFMVDFVKCAKRRKKLRKNPNFGCLYLGNGWSDFLQIENCIFFLPVNILTVWRAGFLGRTTHYCMSRSVWHTGFLGRTTHYRVS